MPDLATDLREYVDALVAPTDLDDIRQRAGVEHARLPRRFAVLTAAAAAITLVAIGALVLRRDGGGDVRAVDTAPAESEAELVASDAEGRVGVFDAATGHQVRTLTDREPGGGAGDPVVTDDGRYLYFARALGTCASAIDRIDLRTGAVTRIVGSPDGPPAWNPAVTPDGTFLAYTTGGCGSDVATIVIRDLVTRTSRTYPMGNPPAVAGRIALSPDGRYLAYPYVSGGGVAYGVRQLDLLSQATSAEDVLALEVGDCGRQAAPAYQSDGILLVVTCDAEDPARTVVAAFDYTGVRYRQVLVVPGVDDASDVLSLDVASADGSLLYETVDGTFRSDGDQVRRVELPAGTRGAVWLPAKPPAAAAPVVTFDPPVGVRGGFVTITVHGLESFVGVEYDALIWHLDEQGAQGFNGERAVVDQDGVLTFETMVPAVIEHEHWVVPGTYRIAFSAIDHSSASFQAPLEVVAADVDVPYRHAIYVHCGVERTHFDGRMWMVSPPPGDDSHNPPPGWDENLQPGTFTMLDDEHAVFETSFGARVDFRVATPEETAAYDATTEVCE